MGPATRELVAFVYGAVVGMVVVGAQVAQLLAFGTAEVRDSARRVAPEAQERVCAAMADGFEERMRARIHERQDEIEVSIVARLARFDRTLREHERRLDGQVEKLADHDQRLHFHDVDLGQVLGRVEMTEVRLTLADDALCRLAPKACSGPHGAPWKPSVRSSSTTWTSAQGRRECLGRGIDGCDPRTGRRDP